MMGLFKPYTLGIANIYEPGHEKMCLMSYATNKGADQPAHTSNFIVHSSHFTVHTS